MKRYTFNSLEIQIRMCQFPQKIYIFTIKVYSPVFIKCFVFCYQSHDCHSVHMIWDTFWVRYLSIYPSCPWYSLVENSLSNIVKKSASSTDFIWLDSLSLHMLLIFKNKSVNPLNVQEQNKPTKSSMSVQKPIFLGVYYTHTKHDKEIAVLWGLFCIFCTNKPHHLLCSFPW